MYSYNDFEPNLKTIISLNERGHRSQNYLGTMVDMHDTRSGAARRGGEFCSVA